ncbi:MAG: enoyl-CoA hydratase/isomerase family protein [Acidimicrobiaceae bacterium]|nr:enoyl-CoA hydratase/isomerase family protein [Acidimicrobiaceae bacterium]MBO0748102.1 enoyl-CoA hydratase/isomerase family protein [Acidimicrobiaceae bacterium]
MDAASGTDSVPTGVVDERYGDVSVVLEAGGVATVEIHRPPANFFDVALIHSLAEAYAALGAGPTRAIVLCAEGRHFCAGADFSGASSAEFLDVERAASLYAEAAKLFEVPVPVVAAVQGAAIGGGLGLACSADFRVASAGSRFSANFARLGFHHGFGLSVTLPEIVGGQRAAELLYTGRRIGGEVAAAIGLADRLVPEGQIREEARGLAGEIAGSAPLAVRSIKATLRGNLADRIREVTPREDGEQARLRTTEDFAEGLAASAERRDPRFHGR